MNRVVLPLVAALLVAVVLGVQLAAGGANYVPLRPADPCTQHSLPPTAPKLQPLIEQVVLLGLNDAACRLGISRERLVLALADPRSLRPGAIGALRAGLRDAVSRLAREHRLPKVSGLLPQMLDQANLPGIAIAIIKAIPAGIIDSALPTGPLLSRTVDELDINRLLRELGDPSRLQSVIESALLRAAASEIFARLQP
jgi:hypothetical protein